MDDGKPDRESDIFRHYRKAVEQGEPWAIQRHPDHIPPGELEQSS